MGGWMWGRNSDLDESIRTIRSAVERGITLIDSAPVYGFGRSEEIVGMALSGGLRHRAVIATKVGLEWCGGAGLPRAPCRRSPDRKSTRLNSSHQIISYAVFCLKKKKNNIKYTDMIVV